MGTTSNILRGIVIIPTHRRLIRCDYQIPIGEICRCFNVKRDIVCGNWNGVIPCYTMVE